MSAESVQQIIGRAIGDGAFRELLFSNPDQALAGFDLTAEETSALKGLKREEFDAAASDLEQRISKTFAGMQIASVVGGAIAQPAARLPVNFLKLE